MSKKKKRKEVIVRNRVRSDLTGVQLGETLCYEQLLLFFSSSLTCDCLMFFILLIFTQVYLQEYTSCQTHVLHVFASW
jgi:hypothetical protein